MIVTMQSLLVLNSKVLRLIMKISKVTKASSVSPSFKPTAIANNAVPAPVRTISPGTGSRCRRENSWYTQMARQMSIATAEILKKCGRLQTITVMRAGSAADAVMFLSRAFIYKAQGP